jgi:predicted house-cleaning NTP pyrophosphatase (Maf/HAM1 superfamily)
MGRLKKAARKAADAADAVAIWMMMAVAVLSILLAVTIARKEQQRWKCTTSTQAKPRLSPSRL